MDDVTATFKSHYARTFEAHGATARGVDWGAAEDVVLRYEKMLAVIDPARSSGRASLLDVGAGYGGLWQEIKRCGLAVDYSGIDVCENMIAWAQQHEQGATFRVADVFAEGAAQSFDYVVANGILTQKLETTITAMDVFAQRLIRRLFDLCRVGVAFNVMTTKVNFTAPNLYYRNPSELMAWCQAEITQKVKIDHAYRLYEYTVYLYRG